MYLKHFNFLPFSFYSLFTSFLIVYCTKIPTNVIELNDRFLDVMDKGLWFVELMPTWELVGHALADKQSPVHVGKLDCTRFTNVASALSIRGYPTVIFFRNGIKIPYEGERRKEDILKFAEKCAGPVVDSIQTNEQFVELLKSADKEPFFVFLDSTEKNSLQKKMWLEYENSADMLFAEVRFFKTVDKKIVQERIINSSEEMVFLVAFKDSDYWVKFGIAEFEQGQSISDWIKRERWPSMLQLTSLNLHSVANSNTEKKLVLISVEAFDRLNSSTPSGRFYFLKETFVFFSFYELANKAAINLRSLPELNERFQFGWLEGDQIANGIVMGSLSLPSLVVFNFSSYEFYLSDDFQDVNEQMTVNSLILFLQRISDGQVKAQGGRAWITRIKRMIYDITTNLFDMFKHQPILTVCLFGVPLAFFSIITYSICSADFSVDRDEIYPEDEDIIDEEEGEEENELEEEEEPLIASTSAIEGIKGHTRKNTPFIHRPSVLSSDSSRYQNSYRSSYQFSSPTDDLVFDHFDRQYLFCCGRSHSTIGVRIITGMLCLSVLYEFWLIIQHILTNQQHSLPIFDSLVQLLFGFLLAISMVLAFWLENCALLLPYLLMQFIGIGSFLTILLALLYIVVLDRDLETIEYLIDKYVPFNLTEGQSDGYKICLGLLLCTACFSLLIFQLWLLSIVISCWRYFRDKQTFFIQNNRDTTCIILHPINQINIENKTLN